MPVYFCDPSALADKVAEVEANGDTVHSVTVLSEQSVVIVTKADGRRKPRGVETR